MSFDFDTLSSLEKLLIYVLVAHLGYFLHAVKLFAKSETKYTPVAYFKVNAKASLLSYTTFIGSAIGILFTLNDEGFRAMLLAVFSTSYAVDSVMNDDRTDPATSAEAAPEPK